MKIHFSSSIHDSYNTSSNHALPMLMQCFLSKPSSFVFTAFSITKYLLFIPLCFFIFYIALHQWRSTTSTATIRRADCFIYNMVILELISIFASVLCIYGIYSNHLVILHVGCLFFSFSWYGQALSHILISVEGYLATVHPIAYMGLGKERGRRLRNAEIVCNWLLAFVGMSLVMFDCYFIIMDFALLILSFTVIFFCSFSVLRVLICSGPKTKGGNTKRFDQVKGKAMLTVVIILEVLLLRFSLNLAWVVMFIFFGGGDCLLMICCTFSSLPSSLVLPLLFLHREGKLHCCSKNRE